MIVLDYRDKRPLYEQVTEKLSRLIIRGALAPGSKMPSVRSLAIDLSVNPNTIQRAYAQLEQDGYLYTVVGRGNYVSNRSEWEKLTMQELSKELGSVMDKARQAGMQLEEVKAIADEVFDRKEKSES